MSLKISALDTSTIVANQNQISLDLLEVVILKLKLTIYYSLNEVGCSIWNLIQLQKTMQEIQRDALLAYEVDVNEFSSDMNAIMTR